MTDRTPALVKSPILVAYADQYGLGSSAFLSNGALSLIFDAAYRVEVRPFPGGRLVLQAQLLDMSQFDPAKREDVLVRMLRDAASTARDFTCSLALDGKLSMLLLQQSVEPPVDLRRLESELADFVNVLAFWRGRLPEEDRWARG